MPPRWGRREFSSLECPPTAGVGAGGRADGIGGVQVKLPVYLIGESIRLTKLKGKVTNDILDFIETDITGFAVSVCCKEKFEYKDVEPKLIFEAVDGAKKHFVFKPPFQVNASGFKCEHFKEWGLELVQGEPTESPPCAEASHGNHVYLMPFFLTMTKCSQY